MTDESRLIAKLTQTERNLLTDLILKYQAIDILLKKLVYEQVKCEEDKEKFFQQIRKEHDIPSEMVIQVDEEGNIIEE